MDTKKAKLSIKPVQRVQLPPNWPNNTWKALHTAFNEIHRQNASGLSFEELYRTAYNMVLHKYGDMLYKGLQQVVDEHLSSVSQRVASAHDENFLSELDRVWSDHKTSMVMIRDILMYLDRVYVPNHSVLPVYDLGLTIFRDNIVRNARNQTRLLNTMLMMIEKERNGEVINRSLLKSITQMLIDLGVNSRSVYEDDFETPFLVQSSLFYKMESQEFIASNSCSDYMKKVERRLKEEVHRVQHYLDHSTDPKIKKVVEKELIENHMKTLVEMENSGLETMLRDDKVEDLHRMYQLFGRVEGGLTLMSSVMSNYVRETGKAIVMDQEKAKEQGTFVQSLLQLKDKYDHLLDNAFNKDKTFQRSLNQAFEHFINLNPKSPEYISLFIDDKLKKGLKGLSEEEVEITLDKVMMLFRFIQEKDVFEKYYKQHLAKRLLLGRSVSDDAERNMIAKLKTECGYQFTSKLEGMFTDMKLSTETMEGFKSHASEESLNGIDLNVHVLTTGFWPTQSASKCNLPTEILQCCETFEKFYIYISNHNGRRLTWQTNMGTAELRGFFSGRKHELSVSTYQMCILLLFNNNETMTFKDIREATDIPIPDLKRNLLSLSMGKYKILNKESKEKSITEEETFSFNSKFKSKLYRVKIITVSARETEPEAIETRQKG